MDTVRSCAQTWRTGLTAFITLVTTGVIIKGPAVGLPASWKTLVTVLIGGGLLLAAVGLWQALAAEAGTDPKTPTLKDIRAVHGTLTAYEVYLAEQAVRRLQWGRRVVAGALILLFAGITATWWAPDGPPSKSAYVTVVHRNAVSCGTIESSTAGGLRLDVSGRNNPVVIPFPQITSLTMTSACAP